MDLEETNKPMSSAHRVSVNSRGTRTKMTLKEGLQGVIMDNTNLRSCQDLASANNSLFHNYLSA